MRVTDEVGCAFTGGLERRDDAGGKRGVAVIAQAHGSEWAPRVRVGLIEPCAARRDLAVEEGHHHGMARRERDA